MAPGVSRSISASDCTMTARPRAVPTDAPAPDNAFGSPFFSVFFSVFSWVRARTSATKGSSAAPSAVAVLAPRKIVEEERTSNAAG
jgi:hypothetical protein